MANLPSKKKVAPPKRWQSRQPPLGFGTIKARWTSPTMIEMQDLSAGDTYFLLELDEARELRDWLNKADL